MAAALLITVLLGVAWLAAEFRGGRILRVALGSLAISTALGLTYVVNWFQREELADKYRMASTNFALAAEGALERHDDDRLKRALQDLERDSSFNNGSSVEYYKQVQSAADSLSSPRDVGQ
jgi:hypothetical protein